MCSVCMERRRTLLLVNSKKLLGLGSEIYIFPRMNGQSFPHHEELDRIYPILYTYSLVTYIFPLRKCTK